MPTIIKDPMGNTVLVPGGPQEAADLQKLLYGRAAFIKKYVESKGWGEDLTLEQIMEIRAQEGWKHPGG